MKLQPFVKEVTTLKQKGKHYAEIRAEIKKNTSITLTDRQIYFILSERQNKRVNRLVLARMKEFRYTPISIINDKNPYM